MELSTATDSLTSNIPSPHSFIFSDEYICQWDSCLKNFDDAEMLYEHVRDDHVGRKAQHNLCLTCRWDKCSVPTFAKRDHITSHLRVHIASKPHHCQLCNKGFKRPQDLKKHEKTHQDGSNIETDTVFIKALDSKSNFKPTSTTGYLKPHRDPTLPLTPPTALEQSPSVASASSSSPSPFSLPLSPADTAESWNTSHLSPSFSTNSDLFSSPSAPDLELDMMHAFDRPYIDVSDAYYGVFQNATNFDCDMVSPTSGKRSRDGFDELLSETLGAFANEAKKKRRDIAYTEDVTGSLNALSAIFEVNPLTPDQLLSSLPEVTDWSQFSQFCSTLYEDVSGEKFEPQTFNTSLFPEYDQKQTPLALDAQYSTINGFQNYNDSNNAAVVGLDGANSVSGAFGASPIDVIYSTVIPDDAFAPVSASSALPFGSAPADLPWDSLPVQQSGPAIMRSQLPKHGLQQPNPFNPQYVSLHALQQGPDSETQVKVENEETLLEPKVETKEERIFADMSTQTQAKKEKVERQLEQDVHVKQEKLEQQQKHERAIAGGMMMMMRLPPIASSGLTRTSKARAPIDADALLESAPEVPDTPLPEVLTEKVVETSEDAVVPDQQEQGEPTQQEDGASEEQESSLSNLGSYVQKMRARQAAAAAARAARASPPASAPASACVDPVEAMSRQLEQTRLDGPDVKLTQKAPATNPITEEDLERQLRAAKARSLCSEDPVRKQHKEVILHVLKSIDALMMQRREMIAQYQAAQAKNSAYPRAGGGVHVHDQVPIRTVSSYLPRRGPPAGTGAVSTTPYRPSPLQQQHNPDTKATGPNHSQLRSSLTEGSSSPSSYRSSPAVLTTSSTSQGNGLSSSTTQEQHEASTDSPVLYPTSDLHHSSVVPFELSEEERRFIEEDNAKTAAAQAAAAAAEHHSARV